MSSSPPPSGGTPDGGVTATGNTTDGGTADGGTTAATFTMTIQGMAFSPENLTVAPGATVQVTNKDGSTPHSVTSESTAGTYVPGSVAGVSFDTGIFTGSRSFTIPSSAPVGTVIPFFCRVHGPAMVDATKVQITIGPPGTAPNTPSTPTTTPTTPTMPSPGGY
jgi:plastocyanin